MIIVVAIQEEPSFFPIGSPAKRPMLCQRMSCNSRFSSLQRTRSISSCRSGLVDNIDVRHRMAPLCVQKSEDVFDELAFCVMVSRIPIERDFAVQIPRFTFLG